ncbi:hypothetical protein [Tranquillimonas alkanivorans]|uniref:Sulfotransferase family protein n=1 Tax=Tranquillimonas alkanivorans TaxID=441119 RepID=A0A1I5SPH8_9RHOB|nr:hypothetical protein [Tranquillimonas alkanivorans]SFP72682.1 hypothetical protein SAMN04488047_111129 [Tranquillimonas alkanivorans]
MEIAFHIGAHCTDDERLLKSLLGNRDTLTACGVAVPGPGRYRGLIGEVINKLRGDAATADGRDALLEAILEGDDPDRLILSNDSFVSMPARALDAGQIYPRAFKTAWLRRAFPGCEVSFHLAIRNPATFVPALYAAQKGDPLHFGGFLERLEPLGLRWSDTVARIREANPDAPITVWRHEDAPLVWPAVMRAAAGLAPEVHLHGQHDMLRPVLSSEGMSRLRSYVKSHPPADERALRRVAAAFLDKFALPEAEAPELPGWDVALTDDLTFLYEDDLERVAAIPDVRLITA